MRGVKIMANYCFNQLEISGKIKDIKKLGELIKSEEEDEDYDLTKIIPIEIDEKGCYKVDDIYKVWGTRWTNSVSFDDYGKTAIISFDSAWSPSLPITLEMSRMFNLKINHFYEESGCDFEGDYNVKDGVEIFHNQRSYRPCCAECGEKFDSDKMVYDDKWGDYLCVKCGDEFTGIVMKKLDKIKEEKNGNAKNFNKSTTSR